MHFYYEFEIANKLDELTELCSRIELLLNRHNIGKRQIYIVMLTLEEMVSNIIKYGYDDDDLHHIRVELEYRAPEIKLSITDDGHAFDPLRQPAADISGSVEERSIGGMGILLARELTKSMVYDRKDQTNIVTAVI